MTLSLLGPLAGLLLLVATLWVLLWRVRRAGLGRFTQGGSSWAPIVIARVPIGPRQGIALVRIGERVLAVSFGDGGVRTLLEFSKEESAELAQQAVDDKTRGFKETLEVALRKLSHKG